MSKLMRSLCALLLLPWLMAASPGERPTLSEDEARSLAAGEIVVRQETTDTGAITVAIVDVAATPEHTLAAVLDVKARKDEVSNITDVAYYLEEPDRLGVTFDLSVVGVGVRFHTLYEVTRDEHLARYALDPSKEHDVVKAEGFYQCFTEGEKTRLVYAGTSDSGRRVPAWIKRWMTNGALQDQLSGIRTRAEASE
ncbi:MAG: hypothetical protein EP330_14950 [Deltaproteobacteria bacterium]|nr:MAG: hypothetical protein EP330_14950 [Deltaproteobacteria bacterium]